MYVSTTLRSHVVGDAAAVHHLAHEVAQRVPRDVRVALLVRLLQIGVEQPDRDGKVRVVEVVAHVPPHLAVLAPLLHHRVEEGEHEHARRNAGCGQRSSTSSDTFEYDASMLRRRPLGGSVTTLTERWRMPIGKRSRRVGGDPQPEVLVRLLRLELLQKLLQRLEPRGQRVAVLQHHPVPTLRSHLEHLLRHGALPLAERHELHLRAAHPHLRRQLEDVRRRVGAGREHEHDGHRWRRAVKTP